MIIRPARTSTISVPPPLPAAIIAGNIHRGELGGDRRQVGRAQQAGEQADAVEHDAGGAGAVDGVLERRFARAAAALDDAGHHVRRHARHFDGEKHGHQVVGRGHQAHAERRAEEQRVKILAVLVVGQAGHPHEDDEPERERQQEHAEEHGHRVVDQHAGEDFLPLDVAELLECRLPECVAESRERADEREPERIEPLAEAEHPHEQHARQSSRR